MPIQLRALRKSFGGVDVIKGIDLEIADGEICVFVGPSGCGKSTLLRMVAGLEDISGGEVLIDGVVVNDVEPAGRKLAMVFQSYALYPHMTVARNMSFGLRMNGMSKADTDARVAEAVRILRLDALLDRKPAQLSGGQRQRVAIGRAIVRHPKAFLFDEPLSNLDAELRAQMRVEIAKLHTDLAVTMIYVTHDQVEAMTLGDRIVVLNAGRIEQVGTPDALYDDPDTLFVAGFIGSPQMNFIEAIVAADRQMVTSVTGLTVPLRHAGDLKPGDAVTLGIRPDRFRETGPISLDLTVDVVENLGNTRIVYAIASDGKRIVLEHRGTIRPRSGDLLHVAVSPEDVLIFGQNGQRLRQTN